MKCRPIVWGRTFRALIAAVLVAMGPAGGSAQAECADLALVLAIDASGSIDDVEFHLQQLGYTAAFESPRVQAALLAAGVVDIGVVYWGDADMAPQILPMQRIASVHDARVLGQRIAGMQRNVTGDTGIGAGVAAAIDMLQSQAGCAIRRIINVSGDGEESLVNRPRNFTPLLMARQNAESLGIVINALAIETDVPNLSNWFHDRLITGPGAFVMRVDRFEVFGEALIEKLVREISLPALAVLPDRPGLAGDEG